MRRFTRLTNAFSKNLDSLKAAVALHFAYYDFVRAHQALRVTPAMAAGMADHFWALGDLLAWEDPESRPAQSELADRLVLQTPECQSVLPTDSRLSENGSNDTFGDFAARLVARNRHWSVRSKR